jgi:uncharacterized protein (DUF1800 family)
MNARLVSGIGLLCVSVASFRTQAADPFEHALPRDRQIVHVLNRLAYGPSTADLDQVKRIGVEEWIRMQLAPARVPQSTVLEARLQPLESLRLASWQAFEKYQPPPFPAFTAPTPLAQLLPAGQLGALDTGTLEERAKILAALSGDMRRRVLLVAPPKAIAGLDDVVAEAFNVRRAEDEKRTAEFRKLRPPLNELLTQTQLETLMRGTDVEKLALLDGLKPETRTQVLRQVPPVTLPLAVRREAMLASQPLQMPLVELIDAKVFRALHSTRQLEEVLVDFWLNHFNVFSGKGPVRMLVTSYERDAIRPHVFGRFRDLVLATARHPAMLFYLDNWQSQVPRADAQPQPGGSGTAPRRLGLNENYGRELMELHTLGVDGGYTQTDVVNVARAFTGWTIHEPNRYGEFHFNPAMHDREEKVVLGHTIPRGGGESDGLKVIEILSRHPSTAKFIARKLAQRFVADDPPKALVDHVASVFRKTDGDLRAVTEALLLSKQFLSEGAWQSKLKSPLELVLSALRTLHADVTDTTVLAQRIAELGQPLYGKPEPTGYPNTSDAWSSSAGLVARINFAAALSSGQIPGVKVEIDVLPSDARQLATRLLGVQPAAATLSAFENRSGATPSPESVAAVLLASPDFQKR